MRPIDINTADVEELEAIPGVNSAIAREVDENRGTDGRLSVKDFMIISGIPLNKVLELMDTGIITFSLFSWNDHRLVRDHERIVTQGHEYVHHKLATTEYELKAMQQRMQLAEYNEERLVKLCNKALDQEVNTLKERYFNDHQELLHNRSPGREVLGTGSQFRVLREEASSGPVLGTPARGSPSGVNLGAVVSPTGKVLPVSHLADSYVGRGGTPRRVTSQVSPGQLFMGDRHPSGQDDQTMCKTRVELSPHTDRHGQVVGALGQVPTKKASGIEPSSGHPDPAISLVIGKIPPDGIYSHGTAPGVAGSKVVSGPQASGNKPNVVREVRETSMLQANRGGSSIPVREPVAALFQQSVGGIPTQNTNVGGTVLNAPTGPSLMTGGATTLGPRTGINLGVGSGHSGNVNEGRYTPPAVRRVSEGNVLASSGPPAGTWYTPYSIPPSVGQGPWIGPGGSFGIGQGPWIGPVGSTGMGQGHWVGPGGSTGVGQKTWTGPAGWNGTYNSPVPHTGGLGRLSTRDRHGRSGQRSVDGHRRRRGHSSTSNSSSESEDSSSETSEESSDSSPSPERRGRRTDRRREHKRYRSPPDPKMATFHGDSGRWRSFHFQFKQMSKIHRWSRRAKLQKLIACLRDSAVDFVQSCPSRTLRSYKRLVKELNRRYGQKDKPNIVRKQLQHVSQGDDRLEDFADRVYRLTLEGFPKTEERTVQAIAVETFLKGCIDKNAAWAAAEKNPKTVYQAVEYVKNSSYNFKSFGKSSHVSRQVSFNLDQKPKLPEPSDILKSLETVSEYLKQFQSQNTPSVVPSAQTSITCSRCGVKGHKVADCPKPSVTPISSPRSTPPPSPLRIQCFGCKGFGHFKKNCPNVARSRSVSPRPNRPLNA